MSDACSDQRLSLTLKLACYWLMLQGAVYLLLNERLAEILRLRYQATLLPYIRQSGLAMLALGLLLRRAVVDPRRQVLAVDVLLLMLLGKVCFMLAFRLGVDVLLPLEWVMLVVDLGLAGGLLLWRTRSSQMPASEGLLAKPALAVGKDLKAWAQRKQPRPTLSLGDLDGTPLSGPEPIAAAKDLAGPQPSDPRPAAAPATAPLPPPASGQAPPKSKSVSEAVPRMD